MQENPPKKDEASQPLLKIISKPADHSTVASHKVTAARKQFWAILKEFCKDESGQDLIEYCLLLAFVALCAVGLLTGMRTSVMGLWTQTNSALVSAQSVAS